MSSKDANILQRASDQSRKVEMLPAVVHERPEFAFLHISSSTELII